MSQTIQMSYRTKMVLILLLLGLACVYGLSRFNLYQAEEGDDVTVQVDSPDNADLSLLNMNCRLQTSSDKVVFEMIGGVQTYQDEQFSGRFKINKEALKQGHVVLHVTGLRALDSGQYQCKMAANYDQDKGEWSFKSSLSFVINVEKKNDSSLTTTTNPDTHNDAEKPRQTLYKPYLKALFILECVIVGIIVVGCLFFIAVAIIRPKCLSDDEERQLLSEPSPPDEETVKSGPR